MTISFKRYVDIVSGIGAGTAVAQRELVARLFTNNPLLPPQSFIEFTSAADVGSYFGVYSEEYLRSVFYFSWVSKNQTVPQSIQFARWVNAASAPRIYAAPGGNQVLASWQAITSGSFILTMGGFTFAISGLNFSAAVSLAGVATIIQSAIQAETGGGALWTGATVTYDSIRGGFDLVGGATGAAALNVLVGGGGTDITGANFLGWLPEQVSVDGAYVLGGAIWSPGSAAETITQTLTSSANASNNFGSFGFLTNLNVTEQNVVDAATWNKSQNVMFMYSQAVLPANVSTWAAALAEIGGVGLTVSPQITSQLSGTLTSSSNQVTALTSNASLSVGMPVTDAGSYLPAGTVITSLVGTTGLTLSNNSSTTSTEILTFYTLQFPEMFPMMILAATNYGALNSVQNYEFQQVAGLTPSVSDDSTANAYDALRVNYYGVTQTAGQLIAFYQKGVLMGLAVDPADMNVYANEIWLKDAAGAQIMSLLLNMAQVPANPQGVSMIRAILQSVIQLALNNGTISVGKTLNTNQQLYITSITGDPQAWYQVQNNGYWLGVVIVPVGSSPVTYEADYTLVYSKDDVIRKVNGVHTLI